MKHIAIAFLISVSALCAEATDYITVHTERRGPEIPSTMYGLFFEDINYGADGGLYAEMVKNRSFEFPQSLAGWTTYGNVMVKDDGPFPRNPHYVTLSGTAHRDKHTGLENEGFFGVSFREGENYRFSVWARSEECGRIEVQLVDPASCDETVVAARQEIEIASPEWSRYTVTLSPDRTVAKGRLRIFLAKPERGSVDMEHISLFPEDTWMGYENGLRKDLAQPLADLHPGVFRFPGGCIVEGTTLADRYQWKNTVGPVENRPTIENRWHYSFKKRFYPDYYQSNGLGFYEYFLLAEEIGAEPLPVLSVGLACQYQNKNADAHAPLDSIDSYIRDAVDLVEFANGDVSTPWGRVRAEMGHPEPFGLKYIALGNEQWGKEYIERLEPMVKALRKACPGIRIIGSSGPKPDGDKFDYLWPEMRRLGVDLVDEHFYCDESWFRSNTDRYDGYSRKGPKVFAGEYACHVKGNKRNLYEAALHEAAFMTGLERNADVVEMATYAPLLAHREGWQWRPDMIWFDNMGLSLTSSYYVQSLFSANKGSRVTPVTLEAETAPGEGSVYVTASYDAADSSYIVKIVNLSDTARDARVEMTGLKRNQSIVGMEMICMTPEDDSALCDSPVIVAKEEPFPAKARQVAVTLQPKSLTIYRFKTR